MSSSVAGRGVGIDIAEQLDKYEDDVSVKLIGLKIDLIFTGLSGTVPSSSVLKEDEETWDVVLRELTLWNDDCSL